MSSPKSGLEAIDVATLSSSLLTSLVSFMTPIVKAALPPNQKLGRTESEIAAATSHLCNSSQGRDLLQALTGFTELMVHQNMNGIGGTETATTSNESSQLSLTRYFEAARSIDPLPASLVAEIYKRVYRYVPIRILAFDTEGENIHLLERNAVAGIVVSKVQDEIHKHRIGDKEVSDFIDKCCKYAILSHTWLRETPGEITYPHWAERQKPEYARGYAKVTNFCRVAAREHGLCFGWMDTACINKESSTELDESIRSMYKWYQGAEVCIAYVADTLKLEDMYRDTWFTRGWTLQELLTNENIRFHDQNWTALIPESTTSTSSVDPDLPHIPLEIQHQIFLATSITQGELRTLLFEGEDWVPFDRIMELAARRNVTREEDKIYSLMGLLGVQIQPAYGEGVDNALIRLIRERMLLGHSTLEIINHYDQGSLLPFKVEDYLYRCPTIRRKPRPNKPVTQSQFGLSMSLLSIPLFKSDIFEHLLPGDVIKSNITIDECSYIALDNSKSASDWVSDLNVAHLFPSCLNDYPAPFLFFAVFTSSIDEEHDCYRISEGDSLGIPVLPDTFDIGDDPNTIMFVAIKPRTNIGDAFLDDHWSTQWRERGPRMMHLPYSGNNVHNDMLSLRADETRKLGIKITSSYFT